MDSCPECGGALRTRSSERVGQFVERRRQCVGSCGYRDVAIVRPAEVVSVRPLYIQPLPSPEGIETR